MGGIGSGRRYQGGKCTTEGARPLDIRKLQRAGVLTPGGCFEWQWTVAGRRVADILVRVETMRLVLVSQCRDRGGEWQNVEQPVYWERTACAYGGSRLWWLCPNCGRRVAILYGPRKQYACRHCYKLVYECQRESCDDRAARRADTIRRRLGWKPGILNGEGDKPRGMHWRTFYRLRAEHNALVNASLTGMVKRLGWRNRWPRDERDLDGLDR